MSHALPSNCPEILQTSAVPSNPLEELVLKGHVVLGLETDAGAEDVGESRTLLSESVDDGSARRRERSLEHVAENAEHAVEVVELGVTTLRTVCLPLDTGHHLGDED
jgi:hypothetical protein